MPYGRRQKDGRWQARIGLVAGTRDIYLGTFSMQNMNFDLPMPLKSNWFEFTDDLNFVPSQKQRKKLQRLMILLPLRYVAKTL